MALKSFKIVGLLCVGLSGCSGDAFTSAGDGQPVSGGGSGGSAMGGDGGIGGSGGGSAGSGGAATGGTGGSGTGGSNTGGTGGRAGGSGASGAGGNTELRASDYDQACMFDYECALVAEGDQCGCTGCANAAISSSAVGDWEEDASNIQCPNPGGPTCEPACAEMLAACATGTCTVRPPLFIEASNYDTTCFADSDCRVIYTGEVCSACRCGTAAINSGAYEQYVQDIEGVVCAPGPSPCDCAPLETVHCSVDPMVGMGTCTVGL